MDGARLRVAGLALLCGASIAGQEPTATVVVVGEASPWEGGPLLVLQRGESVLPGTRTEDRWEWSVPLARAEPKDSMVIHRARGTGALLPTLTEGERHVVALERLPLVAKGVLRQVSEGEGAAATRPLSWTDFEDPPHAAAPPRGRPKPTLEVWDTRATPRGSSTLVVVAGESGSGFEVRGYAFGRKQLQLRGSTPGWTLQQPTEFEVGGTSPLVVTLAPVLPSVVIEFDVAPVEPIVCSWMADLTAADGRQYTAMSFPWRDVPGRHQLRWSQIPAGAYSLRVLMGLGGAELARVDRLELELGKPPGHAWIPPIDLTQQEFAVDQLVQGARPAMLFTLGGDGKPSGAAVGPAWQGWFAALPGTEIYAWSPGGPVVPLAEWNDRAPGVEVALEIPAHVLALRSRGRVWLDVVPHGTEPLIARSDAFGLERVVPGEARWIACDAKRVPVLLAATGEHDVVLHFDPSDRSGVRVWRTVIDLRPAAAMLLPVPTDWAQADSAPSGKE